MVESLGRSEDLAMKFALLATWSTHSLAANVVVSAVAIAIGSFIVASPDQAARIWGAQRFANSTPERRNVLVRWYRIFGISVFLAGVLLALDSVNP